MTGTLSRAAAKLSFLAGAGMLCATISLAQPKAPAISHLERLEIEATIADRAFQHAPEGANRGLMILAYERFVGAVCLPNISKTLRHTGLSTARDQKPQCKTALARLMEIDPWNPVAICISEGFDKPSCHRTAEAQRIETFTVDNGYTSYGTSGRRTPVDLDTKLAMSKMEPQLDELESAIRKVTADAREKPALLAEVPALYRRILAISCRVVRLSLADQTVATPTAVPVTPTPTLGPGTGPMAELLASIDAVTNDARAAPTPEPSLPPRTRYISERCSGLIEAAILFDKNLALPICYRHGFYTPQCLVARQRQRAADEAKAKLEAEKARASGAPAPKQARKPNITGELEQF